MAHKNQRRLEEAIASIRRTYGENALRLLEDTNTNWAVAHLSTGFALLDRRLNIGGLPKGHLTHVSGIPTSGAMTLAFKVLAQAAGEAVIYVDLPQTFDEDYAVRCGIDETALALIEPESFHQALEALIGLVDTAAAVVLVPNPQQENEVQNEKIDSADLHRLMTALHKSQCVLILVERVGTEMLASQAAVQLHFKRERWLRRRRDVTGFRTKVHIVHNKFGPTGSKVRLTIGFSTVVDGDGL
jgi:RecA/RadA recombinase